MTAAPSAEPVPRTLTDGELSAVLSAHRFGVLAAVRRTGHPHLSTVVYQWDPAARLLRVSSTASRVKTRLLRRDPHAALHVAAADHMTFAVAEGLAEVSPPTTTPGDATGRELLPLLGLSGDPDEEAAALEKLVAEERVVLRLRVDRLYGMTLS
ncbi:TIGR03618 family F420-dependent PPOX class oxidoreductase [Streptomyces sp. 7-21]|jgi:PPOX class probable F420-dependent enzyme|uniref:TIGR03618 family F420-dependent PPOX class oxidoreductase n=1 Tax=Streptomyces sp. 7-21 TaxID=2802283 RepID=UPI00191FFDEC|nr:TIGR03618 family F420-dependent PPOX class oxidoreductase [Streptomyces sp. 7-21]MBL1065886.1 TIGR03618 family F420-dependent PPOX class oxidoreductase [Streptomyces sp. 7-21]